MYTIGIVSMRTIMYILVSGCLRIELLDARNRIRVPKTSNIILLVWCLTVHSKLQGDSKK